MATISLPIYSDMHIYGQITVANSITTEDNNDLQLSLGSGKLRVANLLVQTIYGSYNSNQPYIFLDPANHFESRLNIWHRQRNEQTTNGAFYDTVIYSPNGEINLGYEQDTTQLPITKALITTIKTTTISSLDGTSPIQATSGIRGNLTGNVAGNVTGQLNGPIYIDGKAQYYKFYLGSILPATIEANCIYMIEG